MSTIKLRIEGDPADVNWFANLLHLVGTSEGLELSKATDYPARNNSGVRRYLSIDLPTRCRVCGCTDHHGCFEGCYWVEADLCSQCAGDRPE